MQLHLQAYRQIVGDDPLGQRAGIQLMMAGRHQHLSGTLLQAILDQLGNRPVVVLARTDDELDLIVSREVLDVLVAITPDFGRARGFQVHHATNAGVDGRNIQGTAGFQGFASDDRRA